MNEEGRPPVVDDLFCCDVGWLRCSGERWPIQAWFWLEWAVTSLLFVTKPWGDSAQYDFIVEHQGRFRRMQVKSTQFFDRGCYPCAVKGSHWPYPEDAFDFLVVYILPKDLWYIIPEPVFRGQASVALRPEIKDSKYAKYLGAWELIKKE